MKTLGKVFFGMVCITLLFACSGIQWVTSNNVTVTWNAPKILENGSPIPPDQVLRYNVYIDVDIYEYILIRFASVKSDSSNRTKSFFIDLQNS